MKNHLPSSIVQYSVGRNVYLYVFYFKEENDSMYCTFAEHDSFLPFGNLKEQRLLFNAFNLENWKGSLASESFKYTRNSKETFSHNSQ